MRSLTKTPLSSHLNGGVVRKAVVEGLVWHPETGGGDLDDVLARDLPVRTHRDPEEGADPVVGVELPEDPVVVPAVEVEGPQDVPACNIHISVSLAWSGVSLSFSPPRLLMIFIRGFSLSASMYSNDLQLW